MTVKTYNALRKMINGISPATFDYDKVACDTQGPHCLLARTFDPERQISLSYAAVVMELMEPMNYYYFINANHNCKTPKGQKGLAVALQRLDTVARREGLIVSKGVASRPLRSKHHHGRRPRVSRAPKH
jgi:hypothetical protein